MLFGKKMKPIYLVVLTLLFVGLVSATYPRPHLTNHVTDLGNLLTSMEEDNLNSRLASINSATTVEIVILTIPTTNGEDTIMYANHVGEENGVGKSETDNGVIILWSLENEKGGAIAVGRGIESTLNDAKVGRIGRGSKEFFDKGDFYHGFEYIIEKINDEITGNSTLEEEPKIVDKPSATKSVIIFIIVIILLIIFIAIISSGNGGTLMAVGYVGRSIGRGGFGGFGGGSFGGGGARF